MTPHKNKILLIKVGGRKLHLGLFDTFEEAVAARRAAELKYFGEFRRAA